MTSKKIKRELQKEGIKLIAEIKIIKYCGIELMALILKSEKENYIFIYPNSKSAYQKIFYLISAFLLSKNKEDIKCCQQLNTYAPVPFKNISISTARRPLL